jgi:chemotaxis-related protein WspD
MGIPENLTYAVVNDCWNKIGVRGDRSCAELRQHIHCRNCPVYFAGAVALLDRPAAADYLAASTAHFAEPKGAEELDTRSVVIFRIGQEWLALPTSVVSEVANRLPVHSLPHRRNGTVIGLVSVRGELVVCISLGQVLGVDSAVEPHQKSPIVHGRLIVIRREDVRIVCPVDEVHGIQRFQTRNLQEVPSTLSKATASFSTAILSWNNHSVGLLDDHMLFTALKRSIA